MPVIVGANRDEGGTFAQGFAGFTEQQYTGFVQSLFGTRAAQVLEQYPWSAFGSPYTAAYAIGAIWTDSGFIAGIGGCAAQRLAQQLAKHTRAFAYEFADRNAPGLNQNLPGYQWGAGHAMELAYFWPSFDNGIPLYAQLTPAQRRLSQEMVRYWGAFTRFGVPSVPWQAAWPEYRRSERLLSLRSGGQSVAISDSEYGAEHKCAFWNAS